MTLQDALTRRGIRFRTSSGKVHLNCPFCISRGKPEDRKQRLAVHSKIGWGKCLHCEWSHRYAVKPLLRQLGVQGEVTGVEVQQEIQTKDVIRLPEDFQLLTKVTDDLDKQARKYVLDRGITKDQIKECQIGVSYVGRYAYRIIFPIYKEKELVGFNSRDFTGKLTPKYLMSKGIIKPLYHFDLESETVVLSEGVVKALRIAQVSKFNSASLLGHDLTETQLEQIKNSSCQHVILYPDQDLVGRRGMLNIADKLNENWSGRVSIIWPIPAPADEIPLSDLTSVLYENRLPYSGITRCKILL